jgi:hypothetical protein
MMFVRTLDIHVVYTLRAEHVYQTCDLRQISSNPFTHTTPGRDEDLPTYGA